MKYNSVSQIDNKNNGAETGFEGYFPKMTDRPDQEKLILEKFRENSVYYYQIFVCNLKFYSYKSLFVTAAIAVTKIVF